MIARVARRSVAALLLAVAGCVVVAVYAYVDAVRRSAPVVVSLSVEHRAAALVHDRYRIHTDCRGGVCGHAPPTWGLGAGVGRTVVGLDVGAFGCREHVQVARRCTELLVLPSTTDAPRCTATPDRITCDAPGAP